MNQAVFPDAVSSPTAGDAPRRVAFIQSCWHREIVDRAHAGFVEQMMQASWSADAIEHFTVPGAYELPLQARLLAKSGRYAAVVAAGLVVDGGIYRHDFVAHAVIDGLMRVQLDLEVPVLSVVLTPHHFHEHDFHRQLFHGHFFEKGREAAQACVGAIAATERARALQPA
ncbi:6,7-dimethyl-8-ribityllumazine synthase [Solimonas marina]|uniref:6,7-dimethyl-8-ribityllumazine synthase n=1 Tax=Solimonas marina TaxID=2714601 RepID=A0A969W5J1_9GAMM|nr:6,7-dimethyl-8-ribityllumazine synthase [Solimonas marina]NKF20972.1 6,7-dimethyl-8-ribityllumazine synthase [Solimonas marina]